VAESCEYGNETSGSIKGEEIWVAKQLLKCQEALRSVNLNLLLRITCDPPLVRHDSKRRLRLDTLVQNVKGLEICISFRHNKLSEISLPVAQIIEFVRITGEDLDVAVTL